MNIAIIPARGGSKRLPRKNIKLFHGRPLIAYSIQTAQQSGLFEHVYVSTEDEEIAWVARQYGAKVVERSPRLADDKSGTPEVMQEAVRAVEFSDYVCCIYPTAPLMRVEDLHIGLQALKSCEGARFSFAMGTEPPKDAGQWYFGRRAAWLAQAPLVAPYTLMIPIPPHRVCDINTQEDFDRAEALFDGAIPDLPKAPLKPRTWMTPLCA